jgi:hypothetical protein
MPHFCGDLKHDALMFVVWILAEGRDSVLALWRYVRA